jgi:hypothetical protein
MAKKYAKLKPSALGLTLGLIFGIALWLMTLVSVSTGIWQNQLSLIVGFYPGYAITLAGSFFGLILGFVDGFIGGLIIAWLYNLFAK